MPAPSRRVASARISTGTGKQLRKQRRKLRPRPPLDPAMQRERMQHHLRLRDAQHSSDDDDGLAIGVLVPIVERHSDCDASSTTHSHSLSIHRGGGDGSSYCGSEKSVDLGTPRTEPPTTPMDEFREIHEEVVQLWEEVCRQDGLQMDDIEEGSRPKKTANRRNSRKSMFIKTFCLLFFFATAVAGIMTLLFASKIGVKSSNADSDENKDKGVIIIDVGTTAPQEVTKYPVETDWPIATEPPVATDPPQPPTYRACQIATPLADPTILFASTFATPADDGTTLYPTCSPNIGYQGNGPGMWYSLKGDGKVWTVSTCDILTIFDTQISVYEGADCAGLSCVAANDEYCGSQARVSWVTEPGADYRVYVHGFRGARGNFMLRAFSEFTRELRSCDTAKRMAPSAHESVLSSKRNLRNGDPASQEPPLATAAASFYDSDFVKNTMARENLPIDITPKEGGWSNAVSLPVDNNVSSFADGMWFHVDGLGRVLTISTCSPDTEYTPTISIYQGDSCSGLKTMTSTIGEERCPHAYGSIISFRTVEGTSYKILVHDSGRSEADDVFRMKVSDKFDMGNATLPSDQCQSAKQLTLGDARSLELGILRTPFVTMAPANTTSMARAGTCGDTYYDLDRKPGMWYKITGTGRRVTVHTCRSLTDFDTQITVFSSCSTLTCVAGNDNAENQPQCGNGGGSSVTWRTDPGQEYFILVHGYGSRTGAYVLG